MCTRILGGGGGGGVFTSVHILELTGCKVRVNLSNAYIFEFTLL